ncbi:MAG TPA: energy transducer TonB [Candidatus Tumulicola sp.]
MIAALVLLGVVAPSSCPETPVTVAKAVAPAYPTMAMRYVNSALSVEVIVMVGADGSVASASVARSSGYADADANALKAAQASTYKPKTENCKPVEALYLFRADFAPKS